MTLRDLCRGSGGPWADEIGRCMDLVAAGQLPREDFLREFGGVMVRIGNAPARELRDLYESEEPPWPTR